MKTYTIADIFYSIQGEGVRAGTAAVFVRFAGCNLCCRKATHGFDCDTDHRPRRTMSALDIIEECWRLHSPMNRWAIFTGGEPALQLDGELCQGLHDRGFRLAIETNGTVLLGLPLDWICVSPKTADGELRQRQADEVKVVLASGQPLPIITIEAAHWIVSPAFEGDIVRPETLSWCVRQVMENPKWRLSVQLHKWLRMK